MADEFESKPLNSVPTGGTIISVGADPELLTLREAVLQKAGFKVVSTDAKHAMLEFRRSNYEVVVLCHSLTETALEELTREFRKSCPKGHVVIITNDKLRFAIGDQTKVVLGIDGPETLVEAIRAA
jgi:DNA-binding NarL/FixJ family response regulator